MSQTIPLRIRLARLVLKNWPLSRGSYRLSQVLLAGFDDWPQSADIDFDYGKFLNASLLPWPKGFRELYLTGRFEPTETSVWTKILKPGDVVIDGGANWGYYSLLAAKLVGPSGKVFAIEPIALTVEALRRNIRASGVDGATVIIQAAILDHSGTVDLSIYQDDPMGTQSSVGLRDDQVQITTVRTAVITLDGLCDQSKCRPNLIKLDVEGSELPALRGAATLLAREDDAPAIACEWNEITARSIGFSAAEVMELLVSFGYKPYLVGTSGLQPLVIRTDLTQWSPMVWYFKPGRMKERALQAKLLTQKP